jgi:4a-hydroxytetrahydrobiopterin dehydratase
MPERLDGALVESSLQALPHWTGDTASISRIVQVVGSEADELLRSMAEAGDAMDHHVDTERTDTGLRIVLSTHSAGGVTELDIAMASRIEDLVAQATGVPAEHVQHSAPVPPEEESRARDRAGHLPGEEAGEPLIGAASAGSGGPAVPLPSAEPYQPEPGVAQEQEQPTVDDPDR